MNIALRTQRDPDIFHFLKTLPWFSPLLLMSALLVYIGPFPVEGFDDTNILVEEAVNHIHRQRYQQAYQNLRQAYEQSPRHPRVHFNLGRLFERTGNFREAQKKYHIAAMLDPSMIAARRGLARVSVELKRERGTSQVTVLDQAVHDRQPPSSQAMVPPPRPAPMPPTALPQPPARPPTAAPIVSQPAGPGRALPAFPPTPTAPHLPPGGGIRLPPVPVEGTRVARGDRKSQEEQQAEAAIREGRADRARTLLEPLLDADPDNPRLHFLLGKALSMQGDLFAAIKRFEETIRVDKHFHKAYYLLGQNYAKVNLLDDAIKNFLVFFAVKPQAGVAIEIARVYEQMGHIDLAQTYYGKANAMNPGNPALQARLTDIRSDVANDLYLRAHHAYTMGHFDDALALFQQSLAAPGLSDTHRRNAARKVEVARVRAQESALQAQPARQGLATTRAVHGTVNLRYSQLANVEFRTRFTGPVTVEWRAFVARAFNRHGREFLLMIKELTQDELDEMGKAQNDYRLNKHFNGQPVFLISTPRGQMPPFARPGSFITFAGTTDWRFYDVPNDLGRMVQLPSFELISAYPR